MWSNVMGVAIATLGFFVVGFGAWIGLATKPNPLWAFPITFFVFFPAIIAGAILASKFFPE